MEAGMALSKILTKKCLPYGQSVSLRTLLYFPKLWAKGVCRNKSFVTSFKNIFLLKKDKK